MLEVMAAGFFPALVIFIAIMLCYSYFSGMPKLDILTVVLAWVVGIFMLSPPCRAPLPPLPSPL